MKIIYGFETSYKSAHEMAGIDRLDHRRSELRERFVRKLASNRKFSDWLPLSETPVYPLRRHNNYVEFPFRTERLRGAPLYSFRRILNFMAEEERE